MGISGYEHLSLLFCLRYGVKRDSTPSIWERKAAVTKVIFHSEIGEKCGEISL